FIWGMKQKGATHKPKSLSARHWKFFLIENGLGPTVSNIFINAGITYLVFGSLRDSGIDFLSIKIDLVSTAFLLPFITALLAAAFIPKQFRSGKLPPLSQGPSLYPSWLSKKLLVQGTFLGLIMAGLMYLVLILINERMSTTTTGFMDYVYFKGIWAGLVALVSAPLIAWWTLKELSVKAES
ncbi:hypothetical protein JYT21_00365, partial [bacterium AH-315-B15]|nr:hypothetical protein [bacterium AH-315-B15]